MWVKWRKPELEEKLQGFFLYTLYQNNSNYRETPQQPIVLWMSCKEPQCYMEESDDTHIDVCDRYLHKALHLFLKHKMFI